MSDFYKSLIVELNLGLPETLREPTNNFLKTLNYINALYEMESVGQLDLTVEKLLFDKTLKLLRKNSMLLCGDERTRYNKQVDTLASGIYDMVPIRIDCNSTHSVEMIIGKVFSNPLDSRYAGVVGVINNGYQDIIGRYDAGFESYTKDLVKGRGRDTLTGNQQFPEARCLDVIALAGVLNIRHKPICVFYSKSGNEELASLSNMTVFTNLYTTRFQLISKPIAQILLSDYDMIRDLSDKSVARVLLLWLRGHDIGHFIGADNLSQLKESDEMGYMILHELKSDLIALHNIKHLNAALLNAESTQAAYIVCTAEMLRYIRRGGLYRYADSGSAYIAFSWLASSGAIKFDNQDKNIVVDYDLVEEAIEECTHRIIAVFEQGDIDSANNILGMIRDADKLFYDWPDFVARGLKDRSIPLYLDYIYLNQI